VRLLGLVILARGLIIKAWWVDVGQLIQNLTISDPVDTFLPHLNLSSIVLTNDILVAEEVFVCDQRFFKDPVVAIGDLHLALNVNPLSEFG